MLRLLPTSLAFSHGFLWPLGITPLPPLAHWLNNFSHLFPISPVRLNALWGQKLCYIQLWLLSSEKNAQYIAVSVNVRLVNKNREDVWSKRWLTLPQLWGRAQNDVTRYGVSCDHQSMCVGELLLRTWWGHSENRVYENSYWERDSSVWEIVSNMPLTLCGLISPI